MGYQINIFQPVFLGDRNVASVWNEVDGLRHAKFCEWFRYDNRNEETNAPSMAIVKFNDRSSMFPV